MSYARNKIQPFRLVSARAPSSEPSTSVLRAAYAVELDPYSDVQVNLRSKKHCALRKSVAVCLFLLISDGPKPQVVLRNIDKGFQARRSLFGYANSVNAAQRSSVVDTQSIQRSFARSFNNKFVAVFALPTM